jgi:hypothetical protein
MYKKCISFMVFCHIFVFLYGILSYFFQFSHPHFFSLLHILYASFFPIFLGETWIIQFFLIPFLAFSFIFFV